MASLDLARSDIALDRCTFTDATLHVFPRSEGRVYRTSIDLEGCRFEGECSYLVVLDTDSEWQALIPGSLKVSLSACAFAGQGTGAVMQEGTGTELEGLDLASGAAILVFRPFVTAPGLESYSVEVTRPDLRPGFLDVYPFSRSDTFEGMAISYWVLAGDVPAGPAGADVTVKVIAMMRVIPASGLYTIAWFADVYIIDGEVSFEVPAWNGVDNQVRRIRESLLSGTDIWTWD